MMYLSSAHAVLALCANDNRLQIYEGCNNPNFDSWRLAHVLEEHDLIISGISWSPITNKIVTCSHDRNAFVWSYDTQQVRVHWLLKPQRDPRGITMSRASREVAKLSTRILLQVC